MTLSDMKPGMFVYAVGKGPTPSGRPINQLKVWPVEIVRIDEAKRSVWAIWNQRSAREFTEVTWSRWLLDQPSIVRDAKGGQRVVLAPKKAAKIAAAA